MATWARSVIARPMAEITRRATREGHNEGKMKRVVLLVSEKHVCTGFEAARDV